MDLQSSNAKPHDQQLCSAAAHCPSTRDCKLTLHSPLKTCKLMRIRITGRGSQYPSKSSPIPVQAFNSKSDIKKQENRWADPKALSMRASALEKLQVCVRSDSCMLAASAAAAAMVLLQGDFPALASPQTEVESVKITLIAAWNVVKDTYVDGTFNNQNWDSRLQETLGEISAVESKEEAYAKIRGMLATLEDPYTRIVTPKEFKSFQISKDGSVEGVGLLLGSDQGTGHLYVLSPIEGGPAARAGILSGDELVQIDGESIVGMNGEEAAARLRGRVGTPVTLKLHRQAGEGKEKIADPTDIKINLFREKIYLSPVSMAVLPHTLPDGHVTKAGYIHLSTFSKNAAHEMEKAILRLEQEGADSYILDLRNNAGGLVRAGLEVAEMWLDGNVTVVNTLDRFGNMETIRLGDSHPLTKDPLIVLLNGNSASASEILAGALHDNSRAVLLGQRSFGKGKIQSVIELEDGSGLFVTIAKYLSPLLHQIDKTGIEPDLQCAAADDVQLPMTLEGSRIEDTNARIVQILGKDPCLMAAEEQFGITSMKYEKQNQTNWALAQMVPPCPRNAQVQGSNPIMYTN